PVGRRPLDQRQAPGERRVGRRLVVQGERRQQREGGALAELVLPAGPLGDLAEGVRGAVEEVETGGVADGPVVEVPAPAVHERRGDAGRFGDQGGQEAGFESAGRPQGGGQVVLAAELPGQYPQGGD